MYLFQSLWAVAHFEKFHKNRLSVITFNYDRSLEHFLFWALKSSSGKSDREVAKKLSAIPVLHVYGSLGPLPRQSGGLSRDYEPTTDPSSIGIAQSSIRIVNEGPADAQVLQQAKDLLHRAVRVHILGFGFSNTNIKRIGLADTPQAAKVGVATAFGLVGNERRQAAARLNGRWDLGGEDEDCLALLRGRVGLGLR